LGVVARADGAVALEGEGRREKGEGRREKGEGRREKGRSPVPFKPEEQSSWIRID
jgi:hypothetical protein